MSASVNSGQAALICPEFGHRTTWKRRPPLRWGAQDNLSVMSTPVLPSPSGQSATLKRKDLAFTGWGLEASPLS